MIRKIFKHIGEFFSVLLWEIQYVSIELFNAISFIGFGISIYITPVSQNVIERTLPSGFLHFTTLFSICAIMVVVGIVQMFALRYGSVQKRKWIACFSIFFWGFLFVLFTSPPYKPSAVFFIINLTAFNLWAFIRLILKHRGERYLDPRDPYGSGTNNNR